MTDFRRRDFLKMAGLGAAALAISHQTGAANFAAIAGSDPSDRSDPSDAKTAKIKRPNILYIICDDLGIGDVQCFNPEHGKIQTPNIDRLASQGVMFTDCHGGSSVCTPTRYGILTGRYAWRSRLQSGVLDLADAPPLIAEDRLTVPALLRWYGYHTACIGKWHLGYTFDLKDGEKAPAKNKKAPGEKKLSAGVPVGTHVQSGPTTRGFNYFLGFSHARAISTLIENDRVVEEIEPIEMLPRLTRRAVEYLGERAAAAKSGKPFFLYLPFNSPHTPILPTKEWQGKSGINAYADYVMQTDACVGEVLAALEKNGLAENTLTIFTSDNGCSPAAKIGELQKSGHEPSAMLRGYKSDIWDGGHRIPFIARWPGKIKAGTRASQLVCLTDLMATCAELMGERIPDGAGEDSFSFLPDLLGSGHSARRDIVHHSIKGFFSIRNANWKMELCAGSGGWGAPNDGEALKQKLPAIQLYDMAKDIGEKTNVQADHPDIVARLTKMLEKQVAEGRSTPGPPQKNDVAVNIWKKTAAAGAAEEKNSAKEG
ncbi:MAG: arylsulfatase [Candidatus Sumerlaeota bacterium]|nr:arylsulfatase [Candidatus Sumerlaeota bacterium]